MLDLGHERQPRRGRLQDVQRGPDGSVPDRVDLRGDATGGGALDELLETLGLRVPDAAAQLGRERPVGLRFDVREQRCGP